MTNICDRIKLAYNADVWLGCHFSEAIISKNLSFSLVYVKLIFDWSNMNQSQSHHESLHFLESSLESFRNCEVSLVNWEGT